MSIDLKCHACGHEKKSEWVDDGWVDVTPKAKPFIQIKGSFTVSEEHDYGGDRLCEVELYACPKCGTVICGDIQ